MNLFYKSCQMGMAQQLEDRQTSRPSWSIYIVQDNLDYIQSESKTRNNNKRKHIL